MKSKKAFILGAAMAASCFVSAFALAEQTPAKLSAQAVKQAVDKALKPGGTLEKASVSGELKQKLNAAKTGQSNVVKKSKAAVGNVAIDSPVGQLEKPDSAHMKQAAVAAFTPLFPTLDINTLYTLTGVETGAQIA